ncbi:MAG: hypothetical protein RLY71_2529 [Pseudomonadota bacterium]|jgi:hypothetical protein
MTLSLDAVLALSPDDASTKAARGLLGPAKWPTLGAQGGAVWGECQGSGSKPYQTQVDLAGGAPAFRCSCPSRKFPCKHGLALLMLQAQDASRFRADAPPAWVLEWQTSRADKAQKKQAQQTRQREQLAADPAPEALAAQQAQAARRWRRIEAGCAELQRWLLDRLRQGLGNLTPAAAAEVETLAARLVDAQAPGLANRLREVAETLRAPDATPARLLQQLGLLQLACDAVAQRAGLAPDPLADLRTLLGWPQDRAELLALGTPLHDHWQVLGQITEEREGRLRERRVWLLGRQSGRRALLLDHAHGNAGFELAWLNGAVLPAGLVFFAGAAGLRALALPDRDAASAPPAELPPWPAHDAAREWQLLAERTAACPWLPLQPLLWSGARVLREAESFWLQIEPARRLPLQLGDDDGWRLLAFGGGAPLQLMGEWDGRQLCPLSARCPEGLWYRSLT